MVRRKERLLGVFPYKYENILNMRGQNHEQ